MENNGEQLLYSKVVGNAFHSFGTRLVSAVFCDKGLPTVDPDEGLGEEEK